MSGGSLRDPQLLVPWAIMGVAAVVEGALGIVWLANGTSSLLTGDGFRPGPFAWGAGVVHTVAADDTAGPGALVIALAGGGLLVLLTLAAVVGRRTVRGLRERRRLAAAFAVNQQADVSGLTPTGRAAESARLHPTLKATPLDADVIGTVIPRGPAVLSGWEDVELGIMAPRSGKTTCRAVPKLLTAPGAAVGTANKPDLYQATWAMRADRGRVWRFDPQQITHAEQVFWWNPLARVTDDETADRLAAQFVKAISANGGDAFWSEAARELLTALILAAAVSNRSLRDVWSWLNRSTDDLPVLLLREAGFEQVAAGLRGAQNGAGDTREGIFQTARTGARCLRSEQILRWVTPPAWPTVDELLLTDFVGSTDTVYLMSKDGAGSAAPLLAGFLDQLFDACVTVAESNNGRLPVPVVAVIDEAANIAPWDRLPSVASYAGSLGFCFLAILQSWSQGVDVWGETGMRKLFGACTLKLLGAGIDDASFARDISTLVGQHEVETRSTNYAKGGRSDSYSTQLRDVLPPDELRAMPKGAALLFVTGRRPVMLALRPWYRSPFADRVTASIVEAQAEVTTTLSRSR